VSASLRVGGRRVGPSVRRLVTSLALDIDGGGRTTLFHQI